MAVRSTPPPLQYGSSFGAGMGGSRRVGQKRNVLGRERRMRGRRQGGSTKPRLSKAATQSAAETASFFSGAKKRNDTSRKDARRRAENRFQTYKAGIDTQAYKLLGKTPQEMEVLRKKSLRADPGGDAFAQGQAKELYNRAVMGLEEARGTAIARSKGRISSADAIQMPEGNKRPYQWGMRSPY